MKINRLETHDRLQHLKENQSANVFQGAEDCLKKNSLSLMLQEHSDYIYLFAHPRTEENGDKCLYWQPRLTKPKPQENSYLFRAESKTDFIEICWLIPPEPLWDQYKKGNVVEHELILWSVDQFTKDPLKLSLPDPRDLSEEMCRSIYLFIKKTIPESTLKKKRVNPSKIIKPTI